MIFKLLRINQWYKNLVIFLALFFSGNLFELELFAITSIGFMLLCLVSSAGYIINDIKDIEKDRLHSEKMFRPIASGKVSISHAKIIAFILVTVSLLFSFILSFDFFLSLSVLFLLSLSYTFFLKRIIFIDIITISVNFVLRAVAGAFLINVWASYFLIIYPFFFALFLVSGKRYSDKLIQNNRYSKRTLRIIIYSSLLILSFIYLVYCIITDYLLLITVPFMVYALFRYIKLIFSSSKTARHPELIFKDIKLISSLIIFIILLISVFYSIFF